MKVSTLCLLLIAIALGVPTASASNTETYTLGPGDYVQIRISDFRSGMGEAYQWPMFSQPTQQFVVGPDGRLSIPVLGLVDAAGHTTAEIENDIATRLQSRAGLTSKPDASVQIVKFRPYFVAGAVDKPGAYDYRPGLTVLQAVSVAGGLERLTSDLLIGLEREAVTARGDLRVLSADRLSLLAQQARIDAELANRSEIAFPDELKVSASPEAARAMREEQELFRTRREGLQKQTDALRQNRTFLSGEIDQLRSKGEAIKRGLAATQQEYDLYAGLLNKGLTAAPRKLELEQNLAQIQGNQLDVEVAVVRANEDIARSDRDLAEVQSKYRDELIKEAQSVRVKLSETVEKLQTSSQLVQQAETRAPMLINSSRDARAHPSYAIVRTGEDGKAMEVAAEENDRVQPGDVVRVVINGDGLGGSAESTASSKLRN